MRLRSLLRKEFAQFFRDRVMLVLTLYFYTGCVVVCSYALSFDVTDFPLTVRDRDQTPTSRGLRRAFEHAGAFRLTHSPRSDAEAAAWLESGRTGMVITVPPGFERRFRRAEPAPLQVWLDGTDANSASTVQGYLDGVIQRFEAERRPGRDGRPSVEPVVRVWYNPKQSTTPFMVLSMIALAGMLVGMIHPTASIVREREQGTIEQILVTPIRTWELFVAKTFPTMVMGLLSVSVSLLIVLGFGVPLRGSFGFLMLATAVFLLSAIGLGVLVAAVARTLQQGLLLAFFGLFPIMFLSGSLGPLESLPSAVRQASVVSPLRYYMEVVLGVFLKGAGFAELWEELVAMLVIGVVLFALAALAFRRSVR